MARQDGITVNSEDRYTFGPGKAYVDLGLAGERVLGATEGGSEAVVTRTIREIKVDGQMGPMKDHKRRQRVEVRLTLRLKEILSANVSLMVAGGDIDPNNPVGWDTVTGGEIATADYLDNVAIVAEYSNPAYTNGVIFLIENVLPDGDLRAVLTEENEWVMEGSFLAHFDPADHLTEPWEIRVPIA